MATDRVRQNDPFAALDLVKTALARAVDDNLTWARTNLRRAMADAGRDVNQLSALTGLSVGTIRNFLREKEPTDSSVGNVLLIALALGVDPAGLFAAAGRADRENAARAYEELAAENPDSTVSVRDVNGWAIYVSPSSRIVGYEPEDLLAMSPDQTLDLVHPEDQEAVTGLLAKVIANEGQRQTVSYRLKKKDGTWLPRTATFWVERGEKGSQVLIQIDRPEKKL